MVALRQGDHKAAREAFSAGINESARLVALSADNYEALDSLGLSPCGLAVCNNSEHIPEAIAAYKAARGMPSDNGIIRDVLQRFDALAQADMDGILAEVRPAAAGTEQPQSAGHMAL